MFDRLKEIDMTHPHALVKVFAEILKDQKVSGFFTDWDRTFIESVHSRIEVEKRDLTPSQIAVVSRLRDKTLRFYSSEYQSLLREWEETGYDEQKREDAKIASLYYKGHSQGYYYAHHVNKVTRNEELNMKEYMTLCMNDYSKSVIEQTKREPKFQKGQAVVVKKVTGSRWYRLLQHHNKPAIVLDVNPVPMFTHAKGGKTYKILPMGSGVPLLAEERHLRKTKKSDRQ